MASFPSSPGGDFLRAAAAATAAEAVAAEGNPPGDAELLKAAEYVYAEYYRKPYSDDDGHHEAPPRVGSRRGEADAPHHVMVRAPPLPRRRVISATRGGECEADSLETGKEFVRVERPNHGLCHALRKALLVPYVVSAAR